MSGRLSSWTLLAWPLTLNESSHRKKQVSDLDKKSNLRYQRVRWVSYASRMSAVLLSAYERPHLIFR
jgi:hypothetical protein